MLDVYIGHATCCASASHRVPVPVQCSMVTVKEPGPAYRTVNMTRLRRSLAIIE